MISHSRLEIIEKIEAVDSAALIGAARRLIDDGRPTIAALGPIDGLDDYDKIAARFG